MANKLLMLGVAALALLMVSAASSPADAHRGGHRSYGGGHFRHFHAGPRHHHHHFHRHRGIYLGAPLLYGGYYYYGDYYGGGCYWLRRRAIYTGSPYWWNRYYACINGY